MFIRPQWRESGTADLGAFLWKLDGLTWLLMGCLQFGILARSCGTTGLTIKLSDAANQQQCPCFKRNKSDMEMTLNQIPLQPGGNSSFKCARGVLKGGIDEHPGRRINYITGSSLAFGPDLFQSQVVRSCGRVERKGGIKFGPSRRAVMRTNVSPRHSR